MSASCILNGHVFVCGISIYLHLILQVKAILVNIFGGIVDCEIVANGITSAYERLSVNVPLIVRLEGKLL